MIELRDLTLDAADGRLLLEGLDLELPAGSSHLLTGPSGCGKSRLLRVIAGVEAPVRGRVRVGGIGVWPGEGALALIGRVRVGLSFSSGGLLSNLSLQDNLLLPLRFAGLPDEETLHRVQDALERLELLAVAGLRPHAVSASARKHANLARVLVLDPDLVLLDDPLEGLDAGDRATTLDLIRGWAASPTCTLVIAAEDGEPFAGLVPGRISLAAAAPFVESL